jgi:nickel-type superoxide dismutase maturation protease
MRRSTRHYLGTVAVICIGLWRLIGRVEVTGDSMLPALVPGDRLLVVRGARPRVGQVVALADPRRPERTVVKRVAGRGPAGVTVLGDNAGASTDSRTWGPVPPASIRGRAVYRYFPDSRRTRL